MIVRLGDLKSGFYVEDDGPEIPESESDSGGARFEFTDVQVVAEE